MVCNKVRGEQSVTMHDHSGKLWVGRCVLKDQVYWTDWEEESIFKVNKFADVHAESEVSNVLIQLYAPMDLHVYHRLKQPRG